MVSQPFLRHDWPGDTGPRPEALAPTRMWLQACHGFLKE